MKINKVYLNALLVPLILSKNNIYIFKSFWETIAVRKPVDWAVQWARNQVAIKYGLDNREFATPVLYMRAKDGNVF